MLKELHEVWIQVTVQLQGIRNGIDPVNIKCNQRCSKEALMFLNSENFCDRCYDLNNLPFLHQFLNQPFGPYKCGPSSGSEDLILFYWSANYIVLNAVTVPMSGWMWQLVPFMLNSRGSSFTFIRRVSRNGCFWFSHFSKARLNEFQCKK